MKYILDLEKVEGTKLWKAKGFNSLVFDQNGLDKLEKVKRLPVEVIASVDKIHILDKQIDAILDLMMCTTELVDADSIKNASEMLLTMKDEIITELMTIEGYIFKENKNND